MGPFWILDLLLALLQAIFLIMTLRNYSPLRDTPVGKLLVATSSIFLAQSILMLVFFVNWAEKGYDVRVAGPLLLISGLGALGSALLYAISRY